MFKSFLSGLKDRLEKLLGKSNLQFISLAKDYLSAEMFIKMVAFASIFFLTRLLTPAGFGIISIFDSLVQIFSMLMGLNLAKAVNRYFFEETGDFKSFLGTNLVFIIGFLLLISPVLIIYRRGMADFLEIDPKLLVYVTVTAGIMVFYGIYTLLLMARKESKRFALFTVIYRPALLAVAIVWIILLPQEKYMGYIYGSVLVTGSLSLYMLYCLFKESEFHFDAKYLKYSLLFGIPAMPYSMSHFILIHFDRIIINQIVGADSAGLYSFAYKIGMLLNMIVMAFDKAWTPMFFEFINADKRNDITKLAANFAGYISVISVGLVLFSEEVVLLLADKSYYASIPVITPIILGYVFYFLYVIYVHYAFYRRVTWLVSLISIIAGAVNVVLNYKLIPIYGYQAAAWTTLASYFLMFLMHYLNVRFVLKEKVIPLLVPVKYILWAVPAAAVEYFLWFSGYPYYVKIPVKILVLAVVVFVVLGKKIMGKMRKRAN